jgi:hypothetical protein
MNFSVYTDVHVNNPTRHAYLTPKGEDAYYRHHSLTWPHPFAHLRARLAALRLPRILDLASHPTDPVLK